METVLVATLLADRKAYSQTLALSRNYELEGNRKLYVNVETKGEWGPLGNWAPLYQLAYEHAETLYWDFWSRRSNWWTGPTFDQDPSRLSPIVIARNMAIEAAKGLGASHLLFVDSDVVIPRDSIPKLLALKKPLVGGIVPGRGAHSTAQYVFGVKATYRDNGVPLILCDHGTCGFMMIEKKVFDRIPFRWGPSWKNPSEMLSEDPAFCEDVLKAGFGPMVIRADLVAEHRDDPENPLTLETAVNSYDK